MEVFVAELVGTALLILLGNGVVANVVLKGTKGHDAGWIVICAGWGFAVFVAVACVGEISGAHLNPAVSIGLAAAGAGEMTWSRLPEYVSAQMIGAVLGASLVFLFYRPHYSATDDADAKLATFCTGPAIRTKPTNFFCEVLATAVLVLAVLMHVPAEFAMSDGPPVEVGLGSIGALEVGLVVFAIGLSLGGTTGYAINPARDLGPRIAHAVLPVPGKRDSDWSYAAIPVVGPVLGALLAVGLSRLLGSN